MFQSGTQTLPESALDSDDAWWEAIRTAEGAARAKSLALHKATILVNQRRDRNGRLRIRVTLENESVAPRRRPRGHDDRELGRDMHLFNSVSARAPRRRTLPRDRVRAGTGGLPLRSAAPGLGARLATLSPKASTPAASRCRSTVQPEAVRSTTWPIFRQRRLKTNPDYEIAFAELAGDGWRGALGRVEQGMRRFLSEWDEELCEAGVDRRPPRRVRTRPRLRSPTRSAASRSVCAHSTKTRTSLARSARRTSSSTGSAAAARSRAGASSSSSTR